MEVKAGRAWRDLGAVIKSAASSASLEFAEERPVLRPPSARPLSGHSPVNSEEAALAADLITAFRFCSGEAALAADRITASKITQNL